MAGTRNTDWNIEDMSVAAYRVPTDFPESDGTLAWNSTTIVLVHASAADKTDSVTRMRMLPLRI